MSLNGRSLEICLAVLCCCLALDIRCCLVLDMRCCLVLDIRWSSFVKLLVYALHLGTQWLGSSRLRVNQVTDSYQHTLTRRWAYASELKSDVQASECFTVHCSELQTGVHHQRERVCVSFSWRCSQCQCSPLHMCCRVLCSILSAIFVDFIGASDHIFHRR